MKRAAIIYNEHAGQANDHLSIEQIKAQIESHDFQLKLCPTSKPGDGERIAKETGKDVDTLFIFGGDGTVHECINGIPSLQNRPNLAVLPGGTCNDFARTLGISMNLEEAIDQVCTGTTKTVDVPKMNDRYFLNFFAVGLIADTSENINEELKATIGRLSYFWSALQTVTNPTYYTYTLTSDDLHLTGEAVMILVSNGNYIGSIGLPAQHELDDGYLNVYIVKEGGLSLVSAWKEAKLNDQLDENENNLIHHQLKHLTLHVEPEGNVDIDGEDGGKTPVTITLGDKVTFCIPSESQ